MSKVIKAAVVAAAIVFTAGAITMGAGMIGSFSTLTIGGALTATGMAVFTFTTTLLGGLIGGMGSKGIGAGSDNFGAKFAARGGLQARQIVYGECRVGGTYVHMSTSGTDNNTFHGVIVLAGHEITSLEKVLINDVELTTTTSTINGETVHTVTNSAYTNTDNDNALANGRLMQFTFENGSQTTANGFAVANSPLTSTDKGLGCAYVYMKIIFDAEAFGSGVPQFSFKIKGKPVFDPREASHDASDPTTWAFSDNPALCLRDYIQDTQYGLKALASEINDSTSAGGFAAAANVCDQTVSLTGITLPSSYGSSEKRYTLNGFTNFSADGSSVIESMLSSMAGKLSYTNGKFNVFAGATQTPSLTIEDDHLLSEVQVVTNPQSGELFNAVKPVHVDRDQNFQSIDGAVFEDSTLLANDTPTGESSANFKKQLEVQLPFTTSIPMAQRLAKIALLSQRQTTTISVLTSLKFMQLQPADYVYVTNERLSFTQKTFEVISTNLEVVSGDNGEQALAVRLNLKEIEAAVFNFASSDYSDPIDEGSDVGGGDYSVSAPSNLTLAQQSEIEGSTFKADILVNWTNAASDKIIGTEIAYKLSTDSNYTGDLFSGKGVVRATIPNVVVGKTYNVKLRHLDLNGVASDYTSAVNIAISDPTSIAAPTSFTATGNRVGILLKWTNPSNTNLRAIKIYRKTVDSTPSDDTTLVHTMAVEPNAVSRFFQGAMDGLTAGTTYFFWVRAIPHNGIHSAFSSSVSASYSVYDKIDIGLSNVTNDTQIKDDGSNAPNILKNDQISISKNNGAVRLTNTGSTTDVTLDNSDIGLPNVTNHAQVKDDLSNLSLVSDDFEVSGGNLSAKNALKNNQISIAADGSLSGAGGGQATAVGLGAVKTDLANAPNAIKNDQISISKSGGAVRLTNTGTNTDVTLDNSDIGLSNVTNHAQVKDDLSNLTINSSDLEVSSGSLQAKNALKNSQVTLAKDGSGNISLNNAGSGNISLDNSDVGLPNVTNDAQIKTDGSNAPNSLKNDQITLSLSGTSLGLNNAGSGTQTLNKGSVGLTDLDSLEAGTGTKLGGIADNATNNGSTIDSNGNITSNINLGATMNVGTNSDDKIVVGNITIDGGNGRILITD